MPLSGKMSDVSIALECPHCGHRLTKNGSWLRSVQHFNCGACLRRVRIGYSDKVRLFAKHAHLVKQPATSSDAPVTQRTPPGTPETGPSSKRVRSAPGIPG
jgi:hypothetical protein